MALIKISGEEMSEYPNVLKASLEKDEQFNSEVQSAVNKLFNEQKASAFKNKEFEAKIINCNETKRYLIVQDTKHKVMSVYSENISDWNEDEPFSYALRSLQENGQIYSRGLVSFPTKKGKEKDSSLAKMLKKISPETIKDLGVSIDEMLELISSTKSMGRYHDGPYSTTSCIYELNDFCKFLGVERNNEFWAKHSEALNTMVQKKVGEIMISLNYMFNIAEKNGFNSDKSFEFNDLDNHMWKVENGIALDDQNLGFYCVVKNQDVTIYAWDRGNNNSKKHTDLDELLVDVESGNTNIIDHIALKIKGGQVTFVDNALINSLDLDIKFTKNALIDEGYGQPKYPVDIYSFKYQLAYYQKHYGYNEFKFMNQAMLTLGSCLEFDKRNGRFYDSNVDYDPSLGDYQEQVKTKRVESIYGSPKSFSKLDDDWASAVERMLNTLKVDRPLPIIVDSVQEKNEKLDEIIQSYEIALEAIKPKKEVKLQEEISDEMLLNEFKKYVGLEELDPIMMMAAKDFIADFRENQPKKKNKM
jgi:hypothetical protein